MDTNTDVTQQTHSAVKGETCPIGLKIHVKRVKDVHLALCGKWPGKNWVLMQDLPKQGVNTVCRVCTSVATRWSMEI
jgi:hypothetical protein